MQGPVLPKETSGGGYKGSGKPTDPKDTKLPKEGLARGRRLKGKYGKAFTDHSKNYA
tara:strand:+ start:42 stop:212 length:171 start_codon:yes stop_codon:yes gene_type:complete